MADSTQRVFTRTVNGKTFTRIADNPSQITKFVFDGWRELKGADAAKVLAAADRDARTAEQTAAKTAAVAEAKASAEPKK